jgi:DNA-3-methyladenine glycosylase I
VLIGKNGLNRCWGGGGDPRMTAYHDKGWGTPLSDRISRNLKARGFKFVGSTIIYSHLQATGIVNDHLVTCFRHPERVK